MKQSIAGGTDGLSALPAGRKHSADRNFSTLGQQMTVVEDE